MGRGGGANLKNRDHCVDCPTHARAVKLKLFGTIFYDTQARSLVSKWGGGGFVLIQAEQCFGRGNLRAPKARVSRGSWRHFKI